MRSSKSSGNIIASDNSNSNSNSNNKKERKPNDSDEERKHRNTEDDCSSASLFVCSLSSLYSASYNNTNTNNKMPTTPPEFDQAEDDNDDSNGEQSWTAEDDVNQDESLLTEESPLVLEPLGMSISFHSLTLDDDGDEDEVEIHPKTNAPAAAVEHPNDPANSTDERSNNHHHHHRNNHDAVSFWMLWRGPLLVYFVCLVLPGMSAYLLQEDSWRHLQEFLQASQTTALYWLQMANRSGLLWKEYLQTRWVQPAVEYLCDEDDYYNAFLMDPEENEWNQYASIAHWMHRLNLCPEIVEEPEEEIAILYRSVMATDVAAEWKQDLAIAAALSTALTALRLLVLLVASSSSSSSWIAATTSTATVNKSSDAAAAGAAGAADTIPAESKDQVDDEPQEEESREDEPATPSSSATTATCKEDSLPGSALFRLVCCSASASQAWIWFRDADFWPRLAGGAGSLEHCWNLIAVDAADELFTQQNAALKYYVIVQASYYVHSVTFRWVRWMVTGHRRHHLLLSVVQSALALNLLALAYAFPSLRRLMCVGMLALDASSAVRHFWQVVDGGGGAASLWTTRRPSWTRRVRQALSQLLFWAAVLPSFLYTRFYVYPMLWHSAVNAEEWRLALERDCLWKGSADQFLRLCHTSMGLLLLVSLVSLQNLMELGPFLKQQQSNATKATASTSTTETTTETEPENGNQKILKAS